MKYLLDSNIIIYHLNGDEVATEFILKNIDVSAISRITYIEVLSYDFADNEKRTAVIELLESFDIIDTNKAIAVQCLKNRKIRKIKVPDNIIASTAQVNDCILVTQNIDDFKRLEIQIKTIL